MKLLDETESKYYELISYPITQKRDFSIKDADRLYAELNQGEKTMRSLKCCSLLTKEKKMCFHLLVASTVRFWIMVFRFAVTVLSSRPLVRWTN